MILFQWFLLLDLSFYFFMENIDIAPKTMFLDGIHIISLYSNINPVRQLYSFEKNIIQVKNQTYSESKKHPLVKL